MSVSGNSSLSLTGVVGTGEVESLIVWGEIIPGQTASYSNVVPGQTASYSEISPGQTASWEEIAA